ncbi:hypothetical protein V7S43_008518 [Phytophthora oleae]|uniref:RxLR effector protein n=1 Tax=Phytophthora oleae TaxID=2107226 RepID=A0ABD3FIN6_9STRA
MDPEAVAVTVAVLIACSAAIAAATMDKRSCRKPPSAISTFSTTTFEDALNAPSTDWFHKKLRCDRRDHKFGSLDAGNFQASRCSLYQRLHGSYQRYGSKVPTATEVQEVEKGF